MSSSVTAKVTVPSEYHIIDNYTCLSRALYDKGSDSHVEPTKPLLLNVYMSSCRGKRNCGKIKLITSNPNRLDQIKK